MTNEELMREVMAMTQPLRDRNALQHLNQLRAGYHIERILNMGGWHEKIVMGTGQSKRYPAYQLRRDFPRDLRLKNISKRCGVTFGRVDLTYAPQPVVRLHTNLGVFTLIYRKK